MPTNCESKRRSRMSLVGTLKAATPLPSHCGSGARCWPQRLSCLMSTQSLSGKSSVRFRWCASARAHDSDASWWLRPMLRSFDQSTHSR
eukprot:scaffold83753_cov72-Phaeocystis_antarctica.AAC.7